jgi:hypothetical protein
VGDIDGAGAVLEDARRGSAAVGDRWGEAVALVGLSILAHAGGEGERLAGLSERAGELFAAVGDGWGRVVSSTWRAGAAELVGDLEAAARILDESRLDAERLGLWTELASGLAWSGWIAFERDDLDRAQVLGAQAMRLAVEQGVRGTQIQSAMVLAFAARQAGALDTAEARLRELVAGAEADGEDAAIYLTTVLSELGQVIALRGDAGAALDLHAQALDLALAGGYPRDAAYALQGGAAAAGALGRWEDAARLLGAVARQLDDTQLPPSPAEQRDIERTTARCVEALGQVAFDRLRDEGRAITSAEARPLLVPGPGVALSR